MLAQTIPFPLACLALGWAILCCFHGYCTHLDFDIYFHWYRTPMTSHLRYRITSLSCLLFPSLWQGSMGHTHGCIIYISSTTCFVSWLLENHLIPWCLCKNVDIFIFSGHSAAAKKKTSSRLSLSKTWYTIKKIIAGVSDMHEEQIMWLSFENWSRKNIRNDSFLWNWQ